MSAETEDQITVPGHEFGQLLAVATLYLDAFSDDEQMTYAEAKRHGEIVAIIEKYGRRY